MFFFFFKQKTAYEMRISDWSSDVCSSDLGCIAMIDMSIILHVECDVAPVIGANGHALLIDLFDGAQRAVLHLKAALITQEHDEIGRASCRERVCQYV